MQRPSSLIWQLLDLGLLAGVTSRFTATSGSLSFLPLPFRLRLVVAGDHHGPIGALAAGILRARDADTGGVVQQQVLAVAGGVDPLAERLLEIVVAVGNVLGRAARACRCDALVERAERVVAEIVLRRHRTGLVHGDAVEGCVAYDAALTMFQPEAGDLFGRGLRGHHRRGRQQHETCDQQGRAAPHGPPASHRSPSQRDPRLLHRHCGRFKAQRTPWSNWWAGPPRN